MKQIVSILVVIFILSFSVAFAIRYIFAFLGPLGHKLSGDRISGDGGFLVT